VKTIKPITEKEFMAQVSKLAKLCGWRVYHTHDSRRSVAGFPDLLMIRRTHLIVAELKVGRNKPTPEQKEWLDAFHDVDATTFVWTPDDWTEITETLSE
jgi:hypothetical protein